VQETVNDWIDRQLYPFDSNYTRIDGNRLHYVDEGTGPTILLLHGNPTWSFLYREAIRTLRTDYRCIAPDLIGFGLSDKPADWGYRPWDHAKNVNGLLESLGIDEFDLVVHDWGGPIGLSVALSEDRRLRRLVVMNSWMWSMRNRWDAWLFAQVLGGPIGDYLIDRWDFFVNVVMRAGIYHVQSVDETIFNHYAKPVTGTVSKKAIKQFPKDIIKTTDWLQTLWNQRSKLCGKPVLLPWGTKDPAFGLKVLERWITLLDRPRVRRFPTGSHYLMEDHGQDVALEIKRFLKENP
jgi:haloalkane dehalogenase